MQRAQQRTGSPQTSFNILFELLRRGKQTTRTELAQRSGLSKATVTEVVGELFARGVIHEVGKRQHGRGRGQVVLELDAGACMLIGAQFTDTGCSAVLADLRAQPHAWASRAAAGTSPEQFQEILCQCVDELQAQTTRPILGLGVGVPGSVDHSTRYVTISVPFGWSSVPIAESLEARLGLPVLATNRAKAAALGELWQGQHPNVEHLVYVFVGGGIVAGIIANEELFLGSSGGAGELGHVTVLPDGPLCGCGNQGCLHMLASETAIMRSVLARARRSGPPPWLSGTTGLGQVSLEELLEAAARGDQLVLETVVEAGKYLGLGLANLVNLINPQRLVIGGPVARFGEPFLEAVRAEVRRRALWDSLAGLSIVPSILGEQAGPIGAAAFFLEHVSPLTTILKLPVIERGDSQVTAPGTINVAKTASV